MAGGEWEEDGWSSRPDPWRGLSSAVLTPLTLPPCCSKIASSGCCSRCTPPFLAMVVGREKTCSIISVLVDIEIWLVVSWVLYSSLPDCFLPSDNPRRKCVREFTQQNTVVACAVRDSCPVSWITHLLLGLGFLSAPAPMRSPPSSPVGFSLKFRFSSPCCPKINRATPSPGPWHRRTMGLLALNRLLSMRQDRRRRPIQGRSKPPPVTSPGRSLYSSLVLCLRVLTSTTSTFCHRPITRIFIFIFSITCSIVVLIELRG